MKKALILALSAVMAGSVALSMTGCDGQNADVDGKQFSNPDATLVLDQNDKSREISSSLFGLFLEDINFASYALDDNLLPNGSFAFADPTRYWTTDGMISLTVESDEGLTQTNPEYANLTMTEEGTKLKNSGYDAVKIAVAEGTKYDFSAFIKAVDYDGTVTVRVRSNAETVAEKTFTVSTGEKWVKYATVLEATKTVSSDLYFELEFATGGTVLLDSVALETEDSTVGIKNYLYEPIKNLAPQFIRFPGGCVIEGKTMESAYDWKNSIGVNGEDKATELTYELVSDEGRQEVTTVGEPAVRKPNTDIWQFGTYYLMDYSLGFYEYFLLCDSLGAKAVPIVNCGLSCMIQTNGTGRFKVLEGRYDNGIQDYIQDALDLVAFAKGDPASTDENEAYWANVRVQMGHAEPFEMDYLGIGNEQWGDTYYDYYQQFLVAFNDAAKNNDLYGSVRLIVGNGTTIDNVEKAGSGGTAKNAAILYRSSGGISSLSEYGVQDHHYYMSYYDFFRYATIYDSYSRDDDRYDVFVGEYSANQIDGTYKTVKNSWVCALSEAAYMTGLERNGDVIKLAAYAPMFGAVDISYNQWQVDMMYYTNTELLLSANYYVQQLYATNFGTNVIGAKFELASGFKNRTNIDGKDAITMLYQVVSYDEATGDIIVKIVNAGEEEADVNIDLGGARANGAAQVTTLACKDLHAVNSLSDPDAIAPETYTLSTGSVIGFSAEAYSFNIIRIHTK